ncbi:protein of unknown function [Taphrina deformans PYCC 5710]|uniref:Uncharacterized protein n=1 Tax=Taphrina deformans (strain PYCC 5710 / ATCC 11124 / CBS 356.35 / IMI 108563 / JCM 9778 / NBRC 8474) TaxID=1097556 RepID=R4XFS5_TAPDE|nr:protein of unknown function [Taphrina deformans PYCC 5710]|eukprot:CCG84716.1 protein of unknown function [Taphrina deformans PYCC 5710]
MDPSVMFSASQPAENAIQGNILKLRDKSVGLSNEELIVPLTYTAFDFSSREAASTNVYKFTLEADTFIQLCILGNIIQPRKGGGLEGVAQHLDDFCRIKPEYIDISLGDIRTFKINDHCLLTVRLLARDGHTTDYESEEGPVNYEIEVSNLPHDPLANTEDDSFEVF